jgi:chloride channel 7
MFSRQNLVVRILGITLACAASFPVGREGPMVCIGGTIGYQVVELVALPFVRRWVDVQTQGKESEINPAMIVDEERFAHAKRIGCALGGAAGIASAFNAPIGGILYMFEEVTVTSWPPELTFRAFVCTVLSAMLSRAFLNLTHEEVHHLVIFDEKKSLETVSWDWTDVPFFVMLSVFIGFFSAFIARSMLCVWSLRDRFKKSLRFRRFKREIKALEVVLFAIVCALIFALLPLLIDCIEEPASANGRQLSAGGGLRFVRHDCPEGQHREVATLLLTGAEESVKHLFSRASDSAFSLRPLLASAFVYSVLMCGMPGLPMPMGSFVPCLLVGAMIGRFAGEAARDTNLVLAHPGVYALVGSAAMLSGFTHMTIAIVVLLVEAAADLSLVSPIMLGILLASLASKRLNHHAYDEVLILRKGVPFLDAEVPHEMDNDGSTAGDLCDEYPDETILPLQAEASVVIAALDYGRQSKRGYAYFPVVDNGRCVGLTTRTRLEATVAALRKSLTGLSKLGDESVMMAQKSSDRHLQEEDKALGIERFGSGLAFPPKESGGPSTEDLSGCTVMVPVHRIMDRSPYTILEDMPAPRFYPLFIKAGVSAAAVVSKSGDFLGVLTRGNLISQTRESQMPEPQRKQTAEGLSPTSGMKQEVSSFSNGSLSAVAEDDRESTIRALRAKISKLEAEAKEAAKAVRVMTL